jgi:hypothetical protein
VPLTYLTGLATPQSVSGRLDPAGHQLICITMPPDWTAPMTFELSGDGHDRLYHIHVLAGAMVCYEMLVPAIAHDTLIVKPPDAGSVISLVRFSSGARVLPVSQTAAHTFQIVLNVWSSDLATPRWAGLRPWIGPAGAIGVDACFMLKASSRTSLVDRSAPAFGGGKRAIP